MAEKKYIHFSMRVTPEQKRKIERLAQRKGTSQKEAVLALVEEAIKDDEEPIVAQPGSFLEGIEHIFGSCEGPSDLSTNPKYMEGYGR